MKKAAPLAAFLVLVFGAWTGGIAETLTGSAPWGSINNGEKLSQNQR
jgi:hypothetical protein